MITDMALPELKEYLGSSTKPDDFDEYWQRGLNDLDQLSLDYELVPAEFQTDAVDCFHLYFAGVGGARVHGKLAVPKTSSAPGPGVVMFHGYTGNSGDWLDKIAYAAHGATVLAMDCRGQGGLSEDNLTVNGSTVRGHIIRGLGDPDPDNLYYRNVFLDTVQAARILMSLDQVDPERAGALGASQGGALTAACAALEPRIKKAAAIYPFLSDYKRMMTLDAENSAYRELLYHFRTFDPTHAREEEIFTRLGYIDIQNHAPNIKAQILWVTGLSDLVCPPSTQFAAYNKINSDKELLLYPEHGHEHLPGIGDKVFQYFIND
ncbi:MAG TPA: alpha/beta fold hydrolase [Bacillales bacterium]|nr:alpha/beta fold hydrolase [Bacillales bacterium]